MLLALAAAVIETAILFFIPNALARVAGFGAGIAFLLAFPIFDGGPVRRMASGSPRMPARRASSRKNISSGKQRSHMELRRAANEELRSSKGATDEVAAEQTEGVARQTESVLFRMAFS